MRKLFILVILFSSSYALKHYGVLSDTHNSVLLSIGLVILAAYTLSEIGSALKLPRVTGYILTGLMLGPYALKILSQNVVEEIQMFNTLAIGLIATTAGLELHFSSLKKVILPILTTSLFKVLSLGVLFVASTYVAQFYIYDFEMGMGLQLISFALIFATLAIGTSPAISIAVISEMKAKSRLSQMVLGSAIVKDVIVVILLAICLSFAKTLISDGGDMTESFLHLMRELGYSLLAGLILGGIFIAYIRFIRQEMFLFVAAMILATAEIGNAIHLELLLVFIVAGIVVRNFCKNQEVLHHALEKVSLPVFVVFFTNVGAGLNLTATWQFLPVAALFFGARAVSYLGSSWFAGYLHGESRSIQTKSWLAYLPQAGVTLGLIQIAARDIPEYKDLINNIGIGMVTLNLLLGPIFLRMVLKAEEPNGEDEDSVQENESKSIENIEPENFNPQGQSLNEEEFLINLHTLAEDLDDKNLEKHFFEVSLQFYEIFRKNQILPQKNILNTFVEELGKTQELSEQEIVAKIDDHFRKLGEKGKDIYNAMSSLQKVLDKQAVVQMRPVPSSAIYIQKGDSVGIVLKKVLSRPYYWINRHPVREVPLRKLAKYNLEPLIGSFSLQLINSWYRLLGRHIEIFQKSLEQHNFETNEIVERIGKENKIWVHSAHSDFIHEFNRTSQKWLRHLSQINTCYLSDSKIRYSQVEPQITAKFEKAKKDSLNWEEKFVFCRNRLKVIVQSALLSTSVEKLLFDKFFSPVEQSRDNAEDLVNEVFRFFDDIQKKLDSQDSLMQNDFKLMFEQTQQFTSEILQADLKMKYVRGSFRLLNRDISLNLRKNLPKEEGSFQIASEQTPAHQVSDPADILVKKINLHELFEQSILINFLPVIEDRIEGVSNYLESLLLEMEQAFSIITYSLESHLDGDGPFNAKDLTDSLVTTIQAERDKIKELHQGLTSYIEASSDSTEKFLEECQIEVRQGIERFSVVNTAKTHLRQRLHGTVQKVKEWKDELEHQVDEFTDRLKKMSLQQTEREIDRALSKKIQSKTLDTTTINQYIQETYSLNADLKNLPRVYFRLFSMDPIQDRRFFVAHRKHWHHFEALSKDQNYSESQKILIIGDRGIGKSSLINIAQMEIQTERLIRIDGMDNSGPVSTLARALNSRPNASAILKTLRSKEATIIIDDLDHMLNRKKLEQFEELFEIIKKSPHKCHWILSITKFNLEPLDRSFKIRSLFSKLIDLNEVKFETCRDILLGRHRLSGLDIHYPKTFMSDFAQKVGLATEDEMFFRVLYERSHGHLRHLIYLWLLSLKSSDGKSIELSLENTVERGLPMIHEFSVIQKYILDEIYSYHNLSVRKLSDCLGVSYSIVDNETQYLENCGLLESKGIDRSHFEIPNHLIMPVGHELKKEGILYAGISQQRD